MNEGIVRALGRVEGELKGINDRLDTQNGAIKDHTKALSNLPCLAHLESIKAIEKIIVNDKKRGERKEDKSFTRRTHITAAIIGALATGVIFLVSGLLGG